MSFVVCGSLVFLLLFLFSAPSIHAKLSSEIQDIIVRNRPSFDVEWDPQELIDEFSQLLYPYDSFIDEPTLLEVSQEEPYSKSSITKEEALQDVDFLFSLLKYGYAAYQYFGGDAQFLEAKENIKADFEQESFPLSTFKFIDIVTNRLNFINDGHFAIGHKILVKSKGMYMNFDYAFSKDNQGYYVNQEDSKAYLQKVNGQQPERFMWPSLDDDGKVVYRLGMLESVGQKEINVQATLVKNAKQTLYFTLTEVLGSYVFGEDIYKHYEVDGIPVISVKGFPTWSINNQRDYALMQDFFMDAYKLRDEEAFILDIRSHPGGDSGQGYSWIRNFTGSLFNKPTHITARLATETSEKLRLIDMDRDGNPNYDFYERLSNTSKSGWREIVISLPELIENKTVIVVLTDRRTASAGEDFMDALRHIENVIFIGTNTAGCSLGNNAQTQLPNSHVKIHFGVSIMLSLNMIDREGVGLLPDFWIAPASALDSAVKFIRNYVQ